MDGGVESPAPVVDRSRLLFNNLKNHTLKGVGYKKTDSIAEQILYTLTLPITPPVALAAAGIWVGEKAYSAAKSKKVRQAAETIERNLSIVLSKSISKVTSKSEIVPLSTLNKSSSNISQKRSHLPSQSSQQRVKGLAAMLQLSATECKLVNDPSSVSQQTALAVESLNVPKLDLAEVAFTPHSPEFAPLFTDRHYGCRIDKAKILGKGSSKDIYSASTPKGLPELVYAKISLKVKETLMIDAWRSRRKTAAEIDAERKKIVEGAKKEYLMQRQFDSKVIVKVYFIEEYTSKKGNPKLGIMFEKCNGGDLFDFVINNGFRKLPEEQRWQLLEDAFTALAELEEKGVHHRDVKLENFMIHWIDGKPCLKLTDFGYAEYLKNERAAPVGCGSPCYVAPEFLKGHDTLSRLDKIPAEEWSRELDSEKNRALDKICSLKTDIWSMGIVLFALRHRTFPSFINPDRPEETVGRIKGVQNGVINVSFPNLFERGSELKQFNRRLLSLDPAQRPSAVEGLKLIQTMRQQKVRFRCTTFQAGIL